MLLYIMEQCGSAVQLTGLPAAGVVQLCAIPSTIWHLYPPTGSTPVRRENTGPDLEKKVHAWTSSLLSTQVLSLGLMGLVPELAALCPAVDRRGALLAAHRAFLTSPAAQDPSGE
jgi:hypothetical protein